MCYRCRSFERDYRVGGLRVRLRFPGPALVPLQTPAPAHLAAPPGAGVAPALTVLHFVRSYESPPNVDAAIH